MASLTGQLVAETYKALLKLIDNDILTASEKQITDGFGGGSNVFIDSQGFLRANKYKVTNGLATQFLKADGSLDSNAYLTSITGAQVITALGYTPVPTTRTITINGETHNLAADNSWTVGGTAAIWGNITGTLSNQTDLQNALNAKYNNPTGTISQYIRGDGTLATFPTMPGGLPTGGSAGQILSKIDATDYNTHWIDNYATQTKNEVKLGQTLTKGTPVYVSSANGTNMIVSAASNTSEALSSKTFGLLETGGATNDLVKCVTFGLLAGLDTSTASAGDPVWLGPNGTLIYGLVNKPYAPAHLVYIGVVTRVQSNNGEIFVNVQNGFELKEIHDVYIADPANNHGLFYDIADGLWKNKSIATVLGYTPQAQLSGTGFVKASGTTITYDNSTYLTTADAASTYQLLTNLSTDLTASATKYPSVNAVIAGLGTKLNLTGGTLTGNLTISSANPKLLLTDSDNNPDYSIQNYDGTFKISDETNSADRFLIYSTGIGYYNGDFKANKLYVEGGLSTQFIKADGTLDSNTYLTSASLAGYLATAGGTMTGDLNFYTLKTTRVGGNAYIRGSWQGTYWGIGAAATGHTIIIDQVDFSTGAYESITDVNLMLGTRTVVHSGNVATYALPITGGTVTGSITATSFVKSGGTSSQFLMADGSVTTLSSPVTGSGSAGYVPKWTTAANIGSSNIYDDGTSIGIAYSTPNKGGYGRTLTGAAFGSASFGFEAVGGTTTNGGLVGGLSFILSQNDSSRIVGSAIQSNLVGTTATNYGADLRFYAKADAGVIGEVARMTSAGLRVYGTIIKDGGTASQYLMADGSVSTGPNLSGYVTGSGTTNYIPKWSSTSGLGNSQIYDNGTNLSIGTLVGVTEQLLKLAGQGLYYGMTITSSLDNTTVSTLAGTNVLFLLNTFSGSHASIGLSSNDSDGQHHRAVIGAKKDSAGIYAGKIDFILRQIGGAYATKATLLANGNLGLGTETPGFKLDVVGYAKADYFTSLDGASYQGLGVYNNTFIGIGDRASALIINDIDGARYAVSAGGYSLTFSKNVSGTSWATAMAIIATSATDNAPVVRVYNKLGVGKTPSDIFDVNGTSSFSDNMTLTKNNGYFILNRTSTTSYLGIGHRTSGSAKWFVGMRENGTDDYIIYNESTATDVMRLTGNNSVFAGSLQATGISTISGGVDGTYADAFVSKYSGNNNEQNAIQTTVSSVAANSGFRFQASNGGGSSGRTTVVDFVRDRAIFYTNVGIGTNSPNTNLDIASGSHTKLRVRTTAVADASVEVWGYDAGVHIGDPTNGNRWVIWNDGVSTSSSLKIGSYALGAWYSDAAQVITMTSGGNVGIRTSSPNSSLAISISAFSNAGLKSYTVDNTAGFSAYVNNQDPYTGYLDIYATRSGDGGTLGGSVIRFLNQNSTTTAAAVTERMRITPSGQILIGGISSSLSMVEINGGTTNYGGGNGHLKVTSAATGQTVLNISNSNSARSWEFAVGGSASGIGSGVFYIYDNTAGGNRFNIATNGNVTATVSLTTPEIYINGDSYITFNNERGTWGIRSRTTSSTANLGTSLKNIILCGGGSNEGLAVTGVGTGAAAFEIKNSGDGYFKASVTATSFFESSDFRLKTLIENNPIINGIEKLEAKLYEKDGKIELGYFAQDAELIMPYSVTKNADGFLNLSYREVHTAKIARLEQRVAELEKQLNLN